MTTLRPDQLPADIQQYLVELDALAQGKIDYCIHCRKPITELVQVGRSVYAEPCNCRQYQGRVPDAWKGKAHAD